MVFSHHSSHRKWNVKSSWIYVVGQSIVRIVLCCWVMWVLHCAQCTYILLKYYESSGVVYHNNYEHVPLTSDKHTFSTLDLMFWQFKPNNLLFCQVFLCIFTWSKCFSICFENDVFNFSHFKYNLSLQIIVWGWCAVIKLF